MHRIDGPGATVDNKFTDGDPVGGIPATLVTDDWLNSIQEELMSVLAAASVAPDKAKQNQLLESIGDLLRTQNLTSFITAGTATALTLTPSPAIQAYAPYLRFSVKFSVTSGLNPTLNVSAKGPKSIKQYDSTGAKVAAAFVADQISDVVYDGTDFILLNTITALSDASDAVKGIVELATATELRTGTDSTRAATAAALLAGLLGDGGTSANDYVKLPYRDRTSGVRRDLIIQWGNTSYVVNTTKTLTFPFQFPNAQLSFVGIPYASIGSDFTARGLNMVSQSASNAVFNVSGGATTTTAVIWIAVGY